MKLTALLGLAVLCICAVASAQAQENIRLHFELYKNRKQVATPSATVKNAETGSLDLGNLGSAKVSFTPRRIDSDRIGVAFEILDRKQTLKPHVVLLKGESGWVSWKSGSDSFDVRAFFVPREVAIAR
jgi:hypothetical protein